MKLETIDLHNLSREEAWHKVELNINWCINHNVDVIDIIHGKGRHSQYNFSVIKQEVRQRLKDDPALKESGYRIIYGEADFPITLSFDEGHTLLVQKGLEQSYLGGTRTQLKNEMIFSPEGKKIRKAQKARNAQKNKRNR